MQVRQVPFLHELSISKPGAAIRSAACSKGMSADALKEMSVPAMRAV
jgi:hypothetical protein